MKISVSAPFMFRDVVDWYHLNFKTKSFPKEIREITCDVRKDSDCTYDFKALKCTGSWRRVGTWRNLFQLFVNQKEYNVPWPHSHKRGHEAFIQSGKPFIFNCHQATLPGWFVNCLLSIFRINFFHFSYLVKVALF